MSFSFDTEHQCHTKNGGSVSKHYLSCCLTDTPQTFISLLEALFLQCDLDGTKSKLSLPTLLGQAVRKVPGDSQWTLMPRMILNHQGRPGGWCTHI